MGTIHKRFKDKARRAAGFIDHARETRDDVVAALAALKGTYQGNCNRTACQSPGAVWWNRGSYSWYCRECALMLNKDNAPWVMKDIGLPVLCVDRGIYATDMPRLEAISVFESQECGA